MPAVFQIELLGDFRLVYDGTPITVSSARQQTLLAYLLIHRYAPQPRQQIAFLFWPNSTESQARTNLRRELHHLRRALPIIDQFLEIDGTLVWWRPQAPFTLDVAEFERLLAEAKTARKIEQPAAVRLYLQQAVDLYHGPLLPACYDEWLLPLRENYEQQFVHALAQLADILEGQRDYVAAMGYAQRLLQHDPLLEATYRRLMRLYALNQERARALRVYHDCCMVLEQELGVEPAPETQAVYAQLLHAENAAPTPAKKTSSLAEKSALVGRQQEWQALLATYRRTVAGHARLALISGEAGIGKSRLAEELLVWGEQQGILTAKTRAYAAQDSFAYAPVTELLRSGALRTQWPQLADVWLGELVRVLPELRETRPDLPAAPALAESWQRRRFLEALARAVLAGKRPRILLIDDLQWCDQETLAWLQYLLHFAPRARLLLVGTVRLEEITAEHPLTPLLLDLQREEQLIEIELKPLTADETALLAAQITSHTLVPDAAAQLYRQTEGNPLFVVETMRAGHTLSAAVVATGVHSRLAEQGIQAPPKVYAVIQSRLAQLSPPAQELAALAATIGRSFTFPVLLAAGGADEAAVVKSLDELWQRRIIRAQGINDYDFSHDRIREAAFAAISPIRRPHLHRRIAGALAQVHAAEPDAVAAQLAVHYEQADLPEDAIIWRQRAAEVQQRLHANNAAVEHLHAGLALLAKLPASPAHTQQEISLLLALSANLKVAKGYSSAGTARCTETDQGSLAGRRRPTTTFRCSIWAKGVLSGTRRRA